jgi:hypothetical protein
MHDNGMNPTCCPWKVWRGGKIPAELRKAIKKEEYP